MTIFCSIVSSNVNSSWVRRYSCTAVYGLFPFPHGRSVWDLVAHNEFIQSLDGLRNACQCHAAKILSRFFRHLFRVQQLQRRVRKRTLQHLVQGTAK